jgi:hypothetical protein
MPILFLLYQDCVWVVLVAETLANLRFFIKLVARIRPDFIGLSIAYRFAHGTWNARLHAPLMHWIGAPALIDPLLFANLQTSHFKFHRPFGTFLIPSTTCFPVGAPSIISIPILVSGTPFPHSTCASFPSISVPTSELSSPGPPHNTQTGPSYFTALIGASFAYIIFLPRGASIDAGFLLTFGRLDKRGSCPKSAATSIFTLS